MCTVPVVQALSLLLALLSFLFLKIPFGKRTKPLSGHWRIINIHGLHYRFGLHLKILTKKRREKARLSNATETCHGIDGTP
jgi:hypothetical protein